MEYGTPINDNYIKYVGYEQTDCGTKKFFSAENVRLISRKVTQLLMGVDPQNRPIIVPDETIGGVMSAVVSTFIPQNTGDIYSRFIIASNEPYSCTQDMTDQVIEIIVNDVKNNLGMEQCNRTLSIWDSILGDFNKHGLMPHPPIKINNRKPPTQFNMNY